MKRMLVFGTGSGWENIRNIFDYSKLNIEAFVDNNKMKVGKKYGKKVVITPEEIKNYQYDFILIASQFYHEIIKQLMDLKIPRKKIMPFYEQASLFRYNWIGYIDPRYLEGRVILKKVDECEVEILRGIREKKVDISLLESYKELNFNRIKYNLFKELILLDENHRKDAKELSAKLQNHGLYLKYVSSGHTQVVFREKTVALFISVIIPVYKDVVGLKDTLDSLSNQTIGRDKYEVIVVNDGGEPEIAELCKKYQVQVIEQKPNRGSYYSRNRGLEISKGEYLAFVDADIKVPTDWLKKGIHALKEYDYVAGDIRIDTTKIKSLANYYELKTAFRVNNYILFGHFGPTANLFVKKRVFKEIGGFDERLMSGGDKEFGERIYRFTNFKQSYNDKLFVIHPPRDYKGLLRKLDRVYSGHRQLAILYPERFKLQKIRFIDFLKEVFTSPRNVVHNKLYSFSCLKVLLFYWWIKNIDLYKRMKYAGNLI
ncbi:MAG TPA: hypothetical protein DEB05_14215 [Firmicutes bacterium]|nr:hypothetical protein [Bacillota bacterium]